MKHTSFLTQTVFALLAGSALVHVSKAQEAWHVIAYEGETNATMIHHVEADTFSILGTESVGFDGHGFIDFMDIEGTIIPGPHVYPNGSYDYLRIEDSVIMDGPSFVVGTWMNYWQDEFSWEAAGLVKVAGNGSVLWRQTYSLPDFDLSTDGVSLIRRLGSGFISYEDSDISRKLRLHDAGGNGLQSVELTCSALDMAVCPDETFVISGWAAEPGVWKYNSSFVELWHLELPEQYQLRSIASTSDRVFVLSHSLDTLYGISQDGELLWTLEITGAQEVIAIPGGETVVVVSNDGSFREVDRDGNILSTAQDETIGSYTVLDVCLRNPGLVAALGEQGDDTVVVFAQMSFNLFPTIRLLPVNNSVPFPPLGGVLFYRVQLANPAGNAINGQAWSVITLPGGSELPLQVVTVSLDPLQTVTYPTLNLLIPMMAPAGQYTFTGNLGLYPGFVVDSDSFHFSKSPWPQGEEPAAGRWVGEAVQGDSPRRMVLR